MTFWGVKSELTFLTPSSRLFQLTDFVRCMRTLLTWVPKSLIQVQKSVMQSCSFALNLNLLLFWRARWRITVLPIVHPSKEPTCIALTSFHCVCSLNEYGKGLWNQNFQAQKNRRISDRKRFRKIVNPREHSTVGRGWKVIWQKKSYNRKLTKNLNSDIENEEIQTFKYRNIWPGKSSKIYSLLGPVIKFSDDMILFLFEGKTQEFNVDTTLNWASPKPSSESH